MQVSELVFEFIYPHPDLGEEIVVEVTANVFVPAENADSDWDSHPHVEVEKVDFYLSPESKLSPSTEVEVPQEVVSEAIRQYIRDIEIAKSFEEEGGAF